MDATCKTIFDLVGIVKSWLSWRSEPPHMSRDFWMPDQSCRVCYECDSQFTIINRRHHCRLCGRVFCAKCTTNSLFATAGDPTREEWERIRVCNYCFKQWERGVSTVDYGIQATNLDLSSSPSAASIVSTKSSGTANSSFTVGLYSGGPQQRVQQRSVVGPRQSSLTKMNSKRQCDVETSIRNDLVADAGNASLLPYKFSLNRSDEEEDDYGIYRTDSETRHFPEGNAYFSQTDFEGMNNDDGLHKLHEDVVNIDTNCLSSSPTNHDLDSQGLDGIPQVGITDDLCTGDECEVPTSSYAAEDVETEPVDFENNGILWLPPEPEDEEDEREAMLFDDDDDDADALGEWGYLRASSSFGSGQFRNKDKSAEEHKTAMKSVVDGHFRALVAQLLQVENLPAGDEDGEESWLDIITSLSWEAATLLKPDMSKGGGMDPGGYVKVKGIASGRRCDSMVVKGVVCRKNVAHRRMTTKIEKPRLLILGGALEYQRVSNLLSSFDTLLQQEMDHLKMAVAKIGAHHPDVLLVEKSVSRYAQEFLLARDISLVLNIKRPLLERIARCTGAQIVPSIDHLSSTKLGYCEKFHVERCMEDLGSAGQSGRKLVKTLMYFEGCPKPLGCTILLRGATGDELKKVKHVVQYGVFAAYHLALETSFLADEGATMPELPLNPITVSLPDKTSGIERSISMVPGFGVPVNPNSLDPQSIVEPQRSNSVPPPALALSVDSAYTNELVVTPQTSLPGDPTTDSKICASTLIELNSFSSTGKSVSDALHQSRLPSHILEEHQKGPREYLAAETSVANGGLAITSDCLTGNGFGVDEALGQGFEVNNSQNAQGDIVGNELGALTMQQGKDQLRESGLAEEVFPPSPSDHQSILVSLSSRCVWKGTVCERSHLFRIKYYGSFDKPLGRFLRDHLFDQSYRCCSCEMPSEAHVHCYTHRQGTLTISVKKLPEILLPGERDGKIWMWHRCLRCPRNNGFPPATRRVVMSDAAWGLSFGKFLELSFSNHAAASRVASCGHSLHRDCLRFYGFGKMVACFRYASIDVHSVYLPPPKVDFIYDNQEWIQQETEEVVNRAELLFSEILNALSQISERKFGTGPMNTGSKIPELRHQIAELEGLLQKEKAEIEESLHKVSNREGKKGHPALDILEINRLRRQLLFQSYMWDHRLVYAAGLENTSLHNGFSSASVEQLEKPLANTEKQAGMNPIAISETNVSCFDTSVPDTKVNESRDQGGICGSVKLADTGHYGIDFRSGKEDHPPRFASQSICNECDPLDNGVNVRRTLSEGQIPLVENLSETLDAAWIGENHPGTTVIKNNSCALSDSAVAVITEGFELKDHADDQNGPKISHSLSPALSTRGSENFDDSVSWLGMPFLNFYRSFNKSFLPSAQKFDTLGEYNPVYVSSFRETELQGGARLLLHVGVNDTVLPVYDDEPTSIISYALVSTEYHLQLADEGEKLKDGDLMASLSLSDSGNLQSFHSLDETILDPGRSFGSLDDSNFPLSGSRSSTLDPLSFTKSLHARVSFGDEGPLGKVKYSVTCYYAKRFEALRRMCCPSELDYIRSLSRCKKWGAQGGKSNVFFAKTLDDRFIIKQVTKTELESFIKFAPGYFKYLTESIGTGSPTCLAKILGIYQVTAKHIKGGRESKMDVLVMENLLYRRNVTRLYDLKGSSRSRYNPDSSGSNKVLLDQNLIEAMPTSPIFVGNKAKRLLERAVWNDTSFLASVDVMDYSLLVGVDEEKHELVIGIIDFMRQYTWDKHLETWVKASGILGGPKNASPTVISPKQYKKRFRKAMTTYFLMVPDQWSPPAIIPSKSHTDLCEDNTQVGTSVE